jgi:LysM repeat protein
MNPRPDLNVVRARDTQIPLSRRLLLAWIAALAAILMATAMFAQEGGYTYTVQVGDNWTIVAQRVGLTVEELRAANPQAIRPSGWLRTGEKLFIPTPPEAVEEYYEVQRGDGWTIIAEKYDIPTRLLQAANPRSMRAGEILYVGERLLIPAQAQAQPTATSTATEEATEEATEAATEEPTEAATEEATEAATEEPTEAAAEEPTETATEEPTETATAEPTETPTAIPTETPTETPTATPTETPTSVPTETPTETPTAAPTETTAPTDTPDPLSLLPECPATFEEYPETILAVLNSGGEDDTILPTYLVNCGVSETVNLTRLDLDEDGVDDLVLTYELGEDAARTSVSRRSELLILNGAADGDEAYTLGYTAYAAGTVEFLAAEDINEDGQPDVVWIDTTCGASTCFPIVYIQSWDGQSWRDWTEGTITMANAEVEFIDAAAAASGEEGTGQHLQLKGGQYGSVGAGPQRGRTEIWGSVDGAPYTLISETFDASACLYHTILDANEAFASADFETAQSLYENAVADESLTACWSRPNEVDELRSFALFRLALLSGYTGETESAEALVAQIEDSYPDLAYTDLSRRWLDAYLASGDLSQACAEITAFAAGEGSAAVEMLADYGYANPSFTAEEICPPLGVEAPAVESGSEAEEDATADTLAADLALTEDLPECPAALLDYVDVLPTILAQTADPLILETWLRLCDALTADRGAFGFQDLTGDETDELLIFPTIVSDTGYGPGGAEGIVLIYHLDEEGNYAPVLTQEVYGQPTLLAVNDSNDDGKVDLIWQVESCATFCVTGVQLYHWDGESASYVPGILPGAATASGEVFIEAVGEGAPGSGEQIRLVGGVSGTPGGGLEVTHEEIWQSIDGAPFRRISWIYDREAEDGDCLGLHLVEADVALQASPVLGYESAIEKYSSAIANAELRACSLFGMEAEDELALLRGLAGFRLIQAQALSGDSDAAQATLATLSESQPDAEYTSAAASWLEAYMADANPAAACEAVADIFSVDSELWQVTDHYGYDHPALAAEQICYIPNAE